MGPKENDIIDYHQNDHPTLEEINWILNQRFKSEFKFLGYDKKTKSRS